MAKSLAANSPAMVPAAETRFNLLGALSFSHFLNDMMQSLIVSIYPLLKGEFHLSFVQVGTITLTYQACASLLQPIVGIYTDKHPKPYSLSVGMCFTLIGMVTLAFAPNYATVLAAAALIGAGSAIFHPESSRIARLASGGRHGLAQSIFQVGGNAGSAMGPLIAAWVIIPQGQPSLVWFAIGAVIAIAVLARRRLVQAPTHRPPAAASCGGNAPSGLLTPSRLVDRDPGAVDLLQVFLCRQHHELLQFLLD